MSQNKQAIRRLTVTALLAAIVVVLQVFVVIPIGAFYITLTLVPIIFGAILYGPSCGAFLGGVFGATVSIQVVTGAAGLFSYEMFEQSPLLTILICLLKGTAAGFVSGLIAKAFAKSVHPSLGIILSAIACPIVNTGLFAFAVFGFYNNLASRWAMDNQFANVFVFVMIGMIGLNFLVEFAVNVLLIPVILRLADIIKKKL